MPPLHGEFDSRHELTRPGRLPLSGMLCPEVWICVGVREAKICRDTNPGGAGRLKLLLGTVVESNCSVQTVAQHRITVCSDPQSRSMHFCPSHALAITRRSRRSITITTCNVADARCRQPANRSIQLLCTKVRPRRQQAYDLRMHEFSNFRASFDPRVHRRWLQRCFRQEESRSCTETDLETSQLEKLRESINHQTGIIMIGGFLLFGLNGSQCNQHAKGDKRKSGQDTSRVRRPKLSRVEGRDSPTLCAYSVSLSANWEVVKEKTALAARCSLQTLLPQTTCVYECSKGPTPMTSDVGSTLTFSTRQHR